MTIGWSYLWNEWIMRLLEFFQLPIFRAFHDHVNITSPIWWHHASQSNAVPNFCWHKLLLSNLKTNQSSHHIFYLPKLQKSEKMLYNKHSIQCQKSKQIIKKLYEIQFFLHQAHQNYICINLGREVVFKYQVANRTRIKSQSFILIILYSS